MIGTMDRMEHHSSLRGRYLGDAVYGANDGIVTTFAVTAAAAGASLSPGIVVILGLANLLADGFSMGVSSVLSRRSREGLRVAEERRERWEIEHLPEEEREEVREIVRKWGVEEPLVESVTASLTEDKERWLRIMMQEELGFGESGRDGSPAAHGFVTFLAFAVAGLIPLLPYVAGIPSFLFSSLLAGLAFFGVGVGRALVTREPLVRAGAEVLAVGGGAALLAYAVGGGVRALFSVSV